MCFIDMIGIKEISEAGKNEELLTVEGDDSVHTVTVEDKTSSVVVWGTHAALNTTQIWDICPFVTGKGYIIYKGVL